MKITEKNIGEFIQKKERVKLYLEGGYTFESMLIIGFGKERGTLEIRDSVRNILVDVEKVVAIER